MPPNGKNYDFTWNDNPVLISDAVFYPCQNNYKVEEPVDWKSNASSGTSVTCGDQGLMLYPTDWPQCSNTVQCPDPGNSSEVTRTYTHKNNFDYESILNYKCDDKRKWIKLSSESDAQLTATRSTTCQWRQSYDLDGTNFVCVIHHCRHPYNETGGFQPPPSENNLSLNQRTNWDVAFDTNISFSCDPGMHIENNEVDPTQDGFQVTCINNIGMYNTPIRENKLWPNCTQTVVCGAPLDPPLNGTREWISPAVEDQQTYNTSVRYYCQDGSQFDTDNDGYGDEVFVDIRCQWNKLWFPYHEALPECKITHCVEPFNIPDYSQLEEITSNWTKVEEYKHYQCKGTSNGVYTRFWESDRTQSTFKLYCKTDGYFVWQDWPTCIEGAIVL